MAILFRFMSVPYKICVCKIPERGDSFIVKNFKIRENYTIKTNGCAQNESKPEAGAASEIRKGEKRMNKHHDSRINLPAFLPAIIILVLFIGAGIIWTEQVGAFMTMLLYGMADFFGAYINLLSLTFVILGVAIVIMRYGDVVIGGPDAKPEFSMFNWCAMSICSGIGTGLLFWAMGEPIFHYMTTPTAIAEAGSRTAAVFAVAQAMWDWSEAEFEFSQAEAEQMREARERLGVAQVR